MSLFGNVIPSISSQVSTTYRVLEYQFGNGYKQVAPDGINYALEHWQVEFDNLDTTQSAALESWINTYGDPTKVFTATMVLGTTPKTYRMNKTGWTKTCPTGGNVYTYTFVLEQVY